MKVWLKYVFKCVVVVVNILEGLIINKREMVVVVWGNIRNGFNIFWIFFSREDW